MTNDPAGNESTITDVLEGYTLGGFSSSFDVTDSSTLKCHDCGAESSPSQVSMSSLRRLEGASDPDDMIAVVAITCPACGVRGTVVLGFGPTAAPEESDVLQGLRDNRGDAEAPGNSAHGETTGDVSPSSEDHA